MKIDTTVEKYLNEISKLIDSDMKLYLIDIDKVEYIEKFKIKKCASFLEYFSENLEWANYVTTKEQEIPGLILQDEVVVPTKEQYRHNKLYLYVVALKESDIDNKKKGLLKEYKKDMDEMKQFSKNKVSLYGSLQSIFLEKIKTDVNYKLPATIKLSYDDIFKVLKECGIDRVVDLLATGGKNQFEITNYVNKNNNVLLQDIVDNFVNNPRVDDNNRIFNILLKYSSELKYIDDVVNSWFIRLNDEQKEILYELYPSQEIKNTKINYEECVGDNEDFKVFSFHWKNENFLDVISKESYSEIYSSRDFIMEGVFLISDYKVIHIANMGKIKGNSQFMYNAVRNNKNVPELTMDVFKDSFARVLNKFVSKEYERNWQGLKNQIMNEKEKQYLNSVVETSQLKTKKLKF